MLTPRSYPFILLLFQFCSNCPVSYLVSDQTPIYLKPHRRTRKVYKKKKSLLCFSSHQIIIQIHKKSAPPLAFITSNDPITLVTSNFVVQRHHNDNPVFRPPSAHLLQSTPNHLHQPASLGPNPCQCCIAKSPTSRAKLLDQTSMQISPKLTVVLMRASLESTQPILRFEVLLFVFISHLRTRQTREFTYIASPSALSGPHHFGF